MSAERLVVVKKGGAAYAIAASAVRAIRRCQGRVLVVAGDETLAADDVVGIGVATVRAAGATMRRYWRQPLAGLAIACSLPVVVLDPRHLPAALRTEMEKAP